MKTIRSIVALLAISLLVSLVVYSCKSRQKIAISSFDLAEHVNDDPSALPTLCGPKESHAPDADFPEYTPERKVKVNVHFLYDEKGGLGLRKSDTKEFSTELIRRANGYLQKNVPMRLPVGNNMPVLPVQFQYVLTGDPDVPGDDGIYHHQDPTLCYFKYDTKTKKNSHFNSDVYDKYGVQKGEVLNIFFLELHPDSIGKKNYKTPKGIGGSRWVKMSSVNRQYQKKWINEPDGASTLGEFACRLLNHEIGHSLGLNHTWNSNDGCDDTPKNPNCWAPGHPKSCTEEMSSNNVMDYNKWSQAYTPCQLGRIHYNFAKLSSTQRNILIPEWCDYRKSAKLKINQNTEWFDSKDLQGDIVVESGAELTIHCRIALPAGATITVKPGASLTVVGGVITNLCGDKWGGINIESDGTKTGSVEFLDNAFVSNVAL